MICIDRLKNIVVSDSEQIKDCRSFHTRLTGPTAGKMPESIAERGKRSCNRKTYGSFFRDSSKGPRSPMKGGFETIRTLENFFFVNMTQKKAEKKKRTPVKTLREILDVLGLEE